VQTEIIDEFAKNHPKRWLSKNRQMQGAQISRHCGIQKYAAMTRNFGVSQARLPAETQQLATFCDAIIINLYPLRNALPCPIP
jgi:hypothetical protein